MATTAVGIAGAVLGELAATLLDFGGMSELGVRNLLIATFGAVLLPLELQILRRGGKEPRKGRLPRIPSARRDADNGDDPPRKGACRESGFARESARQQMEVRT